MITFDQARQIATRKLAHGWQFGTFHVADWGWENETFWALAVGAREYLVDFDVEFQTPDDDRIFLIDKITGELTTPVATRDLLDTLTDVGQMPVELSD